MRCGQNWKVKGSRMENEYTVEQRAEITKKSRPQIGIDFDCGVELKVMPCNPTPCFTRRAAKDKLSETNKALG